MKYNKWKQLVDEGYSSDAISLLQFIKEEEELDSEHMKTQSILSLLNRKQLISNGVLTVLGQELLDSLELEELTPIKLKKVDKFEEWWKTYPSTDAFTYNGRTFAGTQSKKIKKDVCKLHFRKTVNEGISEDDIIAATAFHIEQAKKLSLTKGSSQLSFIANSERYLREQMYLPFIDLAKTTTVQETFKSNIL